jgi:hypothetical protein
MRPALPCLLALALIAACARFPELQGEAARGVANAPYPGLVPLDALLSEAAAPVRGEEARRGLAARAATLRARAAALRARPVIDRATRARLRAALARHSR